MYDSLVYMRRTNLILLESIPVFSFTACAAGARPFLIRGKDAKAYQGEEPTVPLLGISPPEIVCAKKAMLSLCCAPISLWIASAFALQKLIREICMIPSFIFYINFPVSSPIAGKGLHKGKTSTWFSPLRVFVSFLRVKKGNARRGIACPEGVRAAK